MTSIYHRFAYGTGIAALVLCGAACMRSTEEPQQDAAVEAPKPPAGITASLSTQNGKPLYNLEQVGATLDPFNRQPIKVSATGSLTAQGWAVDPAKKDLAGGVEVVIDKVPYAAEYGLPRGDVGAYFKVPAYDKCGFAFTAPAAAFGRGDHALSIRILSNDKQSYYQGGSVNVSIR